MEKKYYIIGGVLVLAVLGTYAYLKIKSLNNEISNATDQSGNTPHKEGELPHESGTTPEIDKTCKKYTVITKTQNLNVRKTLGSTDSKDVEFGIPKDTVIYGRPSLSNAAFVEISKSNYKSECQKDESDKRFVSAKFLKEA